MALLTRFAGSINASEYYYGGPSAGLPGALQVSIGAPSGAGSVTLTDGYVVLSDHTNVNPLNTNAPILIGAGSNQETVTPTAISNNTPSVYQSAVVTATFANAHGVGDPIASGTCGLQEALNDAFARGGGTVIVDAGWTRLGGTTAMIDAATIPAGVSILDNRAGGAGGTVTYSVALTNAAVKATNTAPPSILPAPGAGNMWDVIDMVLENVFLTAAFANGGALALYYGTDSTGVLATATVAATFLTSPVANQVIKVAGALATNLSSAVLNKGLVLANPTADFITGAGSMKVKVNVRMLTGL